MTRYLCKIPGCLNEVAHRSQTCKYCERDRIPEQEILE